MTDTLLIHPSEQKRIAHDLHHNIHRFLDKVKSHVATIAEEVQQLQDYDLGGRMKDLIDHAGADIIDTAMRVVPDILQHDGLYYGLLHLADKLRTEYQLDVETKLHEVQIPTSLAELIYRLLDDHLSLMLKHDSIHRVKIHLSDNTGFVNIKILRNSSQNPQNELSYEERKTKRRIESRSKYINAITTDIEENELTGIHLLIPKT